MSEYWKKRSIELESLIQNKNDETIKKVNVLFNEALEYINNEIDKIFITFRKTSVLSEYEAKKLLNKSQTEEIKKRLWDLYIAADDERYREAILQRLSAKAYASRIGRLQALQDEIYIEALKVGLETEKLLENRLLDTYNTAYYNEHYIIQSGTELAYDFTKLTNPAVKAAIQRKWKGSNYSERIWSNTNRLAAELERIIPRGILVGESPAKMTTELANTMNSGRYEANRVIRTETAFVASEGSFDCYKDADISKYIFIATLDLRTSNICRSLDGSIFFVSEKEIGKNAPPMHPHCRSTTGAYIEGKDISKLERRARNPETGDTMTVPRNMNYQEWYEKYVKGNSVAEANEKKIKSGINPYTKHNRYMSNA